MSRFVRAAFVFAFLASLSASGADRPMHRAAKDYAKRNGLPAPRKIAVKVQSPSGPRVATRLFVPVLKQTAEDFANTFNEKHGAVVLRHVSADLLHTSLLFGLGKGYGYWSNGGYFPLRYDMRTQEIGEARGNAGTVYHNPTWSPHLKGRYLVMELEPAKIRFLDRFLSDHESVHAPECPHGGCMWWLVHAPVAANQQLAWTLGVHRTRDPALLVPKLLHSGNARLSVVGIGVHSIQEFEAMSDQVLVGAPPSMGASEAAR